MTRRDTLDFEILGGVACQLEHLSSQVFQDGSQVDGGFGADARLLASDGSQVALYATAGELPSSVRLRRFIAARSASRAMGKEGLARVQRGAFSPASLPSLSAIL